MSAPAQLRARTASAVEMIRLLVDDGDDDAAFSPWDAAPDLSRFPVPYREELEEARLRSGADEAVLTGKARIGGRRVALIVSEFSFLAGSIGVETAARIAGAFRRAARLGLPVVAAPASGGTRMQEGTVAFVAMVGIATALDEFRATGLPYLVYLRHPTTGGVMASWGALGHLTAAEPGALLGFLGPRVHRALTGEDFPEGVQRAENLHAHGIVDAVVPPEELRGFVSRALGLLAPSSARFKGGAAGGTQRAAGAPAVARQPPMPMPRDPWDAVLATRDPGRPRFGELLAAGGAEALELHGSGEGEHDAGARLAITAFGSVRCVVVGQTGSPAEPFGPGALRMARRAVRLARELRLPLVTVIDTPGATLSPSAEEAGIAGQIARCLHELATVPVPTVSVLLGQGTGGGAIALLPASRTVAAENAWLSPLPPEGASGILYRTPERAPELARAQGITAHDLAGLGVVDEIVPEGSLEGAGREAFCRRVCDAVERHVGELLDGERPAGGFASARAARYAVRH